jgi:hypothetical protein
MSSLSCNDNKTADNPMPPVSPGNVTAIALSPSIVLVQWEDLSDNEDSFLIFRGEAGVFIHSGTTGADVNAIVDSLLEDTTEYAYYITASNSVGSSPPSETVYVMTYARGNPPLSPRNPYPRNDSTGLDTVVSLAWQCYDPDGDTLTYDLFFGSGPYLTPFDSNLAETQYELNGLQYDTRYNWMIAALDNNGHTTEGPVWHFTTRDSTSWSDTSFVIEVTILGNGSASVDPDLPRFEPGDSVILTAIPDFGWYFVGWGSDTTGDNNPLLLVMYHDFRITAEFGELGDSITTILMGTVSWPGRNLSAHTYAFADSSFPDSLHLIRSVDVDPVNGSFTIRFEDQADTLLIEFQAQDDVNDNGLWNPIDSVDGWGFYDANGDSLKNDFLLIPPGTHLDSINIILRLHNQ